MARMTLYQLRYRNRMVVETGLIEATTLQKAEEIGRALCEKNPNMRYISVSDAIIAREDVPIEQPQPQRKVG